MPDARVGHRDLRPVAHPAGVHLHPPAVRGELDRIGEQVEDDLLHLALVGFHFVQVGARVDAALDAVTGGPLPHHGDAVLEHRGQGEGGELELHLAGLDLREVEGVVDEQEQMAPGGDDVAEVLGLLVVERPEHLLQQDLGESDDGVERSPELVAHVGQKVGLGPTGRLQFAVEPPKLIVHPIEVGGEGSQLVAVGDVHPPGEVALGQLREANVHALDRSAERRGDGEAKDESEDDGHRRRDQEDQAGVGVGGPVVAHERGNATLGCSLPAAP